MGYTRQLGALGQDPQDSSASAISQGLAMQDANADSCSGPNPPIICASTPGAIAGPALPPGINSPEAVDLLYQAQSIISGKRPQGPQKSSGFNIPKTLFGVKTEYVFGGGLLLFGLATLGGGRRR